MLLALLFGVATITLATVFVGGTFTLLAWGRIVFDRVRAGKWNISWALCVFTASVCLEPIVQEGLNSLPANLSRQIMGVAFNDVILICFLFIVFLSLIVSIAFTRRDSGPVKKIVLAGSITLIVFYLLGFAIIISGP